MKFKVPGWLQAVIEFFFGAGDSKPQRLYLPVNPVYPRTHENLCKWKQTSHGFTTRWPSQYARDTPLTNANETGTVVYVGKPAVDKETRQPYIEVAAATRLDFYKIDDEIFEGLKEANPSYRNTGVKMGNMPVGSVAVMTTRAEIKTGKDVTGIMWLQPIAVGVPWENYLPVGNSPHV